MEGRLKSAAVSPSLVAEVIAGIGTPSFFPKLLACAGAAIAPEAAMVLLFRREQEPLVLADNLKADERKYLYGDYLSGIYRLSPFYQAAVLCRAPEVVTLSRVAPDGFRRSEYFRAYFGRIGVRDMAGLFVPIGDGVYHLSFSRGLDQPSFAPSDLASLAAILPVISAAIAKHCERSPAHAAPYDARDTARKSLGSNLTSRERGVMEAFLAGHSAKSVSRSLGISVETVRVHRRHLYAKLGVRSQAELFTRFLAQVQSAAGPPA